MNRNAVPVFPYKVNGDSIPADWKRSILQILFLLAGAYLIFLMPMVAVGWGLWTPWEETPISEEIKALLASVYWWMYGVNFLIYLATSKRIRDAYFKFLSDLVSRGRRKVRENVDHSVTESVFWKKLRKLETELHEINSVK